MDLVNTEIVAIMTLAIPIPGGSIVGAKVGEWTVKAAAKVASKYTGYFFKSPAGKLATMWGKYFPKVAPSGTQLSLEAVGLEVKKDASGLALRKFAKAVYETAKEGKGEILKMAGGGAVGVGALAGSIITPEGIYKVLYGNGDKGYPGICEKTKKLPEGMFCNALIKPSDCASGACVEVIEWSGWVTNMKIGVCSPGGAGNPCNEESKDTDCGDKDGPFQCIENECSNGSINTTCNEDKDCKSSMKCLAAIGKKRCTNEGAVGEGAQCQKVTKTSNDAGDCKTGLKCLVSPKEPEAPVGVCTAQKIKSPCYKTSDCKIPDSDNSTQTVVKCLESNFTDKPYQPGKCWFLYYNAKPKTEPGLAGKNVVEGEAYAQSDVGCTMPADCPNSYCIPGGTEEYTSCAGDSNEQFYLCPTSSSAERA